MAKAMLIMDMPSSCMGCNFLLCTENGKDYCQARETVKEVDLTKCDKPTWCPLREIPTKYEGWYLSDRAKGYNACIDEILGGGE